MRVIFRPAAEFELQAAYAWYEEREVGLGAEFLRSVESCLQKTCRHPELFPIVHKQVRQGVLRRFPYLLLYSVANDTIIVTAVFHTSRNPKIWQRREG